MPVALRLTHPLHAFLIAAIVPLFLGALLSDMAYYVSFEVQWKNFASWLTAGGLVFGGFAALWALAGLLGRPRRWWLALLLLATFVLGFVNALVHAQDAWESMPAALILSVVVAALAIVATAVAFSTLRVGG